MMKENKIIYTVWYRTEKGFTEEDITSTTEDVNQDISLDLSYFLYNEEERGKNIKEYIVKTVYFDNAYNLINDEEKKINTSKYEGLTNVKVYNEYHTLVFEAYIK